MLTIEDMLRRCAPVMYLERVVVHFVSPRPRLNFTHLVCRLDLVFLSYVIFKTKDICLFVIYHYLLESIPRFEFYQVLFYDGRIWVMATCQGNQD